MSYKKRYWYIVDSFSPPCYNITIGQDSRQKKAALRLVPVALHLASTQNTMLRSMIWTVFPLDTFTYITFLGSVQYGIFHKVDLFHPCSRVFSFGCFEYMFLTTNCDRIYAEKGSVNYVRNENQNETGMLPFQQPLGNRLRIHWRL